MSKTLSLGIVISAIGFGGAAAALGTVNERVGSIGKTIEQTQSRMKGLGLETVDAFAKQKKEVTAASAELEKHKAKTGELGAALSKGKKAQDEANKALTAFREELKSQTSPATDAQKLKLKQLQDQAKGTDQDVRKLTQDFEASRQKTRQMSDAVAAQTDRLHRLREQLHQAGVSTKSLAEHRRRLTQELAREQSALDRLTARYERLQAVQQAHGANRTDMTSRMGDAAAAYGIGMTLAVPGVKAAQFEDRVKQIGIVGELYKVGGAEGALAQAVREASVRYGVAHDNVAAGVEKLVAQGMDPRIAQRYAGLLGKVNTATRTEMGDLAELVYTLQTKFKLTTEGELMQAINALTKAGKLGQYELKQMAKSFPELGGAATSFGSKGIDGVREMGMMMQVMRAGAGTTSEADTYMRNWFSHLSAKATQDHFGAVGINFEEEKLRLMIGQRVSAIEAGFMVFDDYLNKVTQQGFVEIKDKKGKVKERVDVRSELDQVMAIAKKEGLQGEALKDRVQAAVERMGLSSVLQDIQATQAYLAYRSGKDKYAAGRKELSKGETDRTIDNDYAEQLKLATVQTEFMKVAVGDLLIEVGNRLAPVFGKAAQVIGWMAEKSTAFAQANPRLTTSLVAIGATLAIATGGFMAVGVAMSFMRFAMTGAQLIPGVMMLGGWLGRLGGVLRGPLLLGLRIVWTAMLTMGRAMIFNPIGATITAIAVGAFLIYKYWGPISTWFGSMWAKTKTVFSSAWSWFASLPATWAKLGSDLVDGLLNGIKSKAAALGNAVAGLAQGAKDKFAGMLGIKSPSRVFMGFGQNIGEGAEQGMTRSLPGVRGAAGRLAGIVRGAASNDVWGGVRQAVQSMPATAAAPGAGGSGSMVVHFSPVIHLSGGQDLKGQMTQAVDAGFAAFEQHMRRYQANRSRLAF